MSDRRGPSGAAALPPDWIHDRPLPLRTLDAGRILFRVHHKDRGPVFFWPGPGRPPTYRFDSASGRFGVLYVGLDWQAAVVETLLRNPARHFVARSMIETRAMSQVTVARGLRLVKAMGNGLSQLGTDAALSTGSYEPCGIWADRFHDHPDRPDGILFASRHNPSYRCVALFERPDLEVQAGLRFLLGDLLDEIGPLLEKHGKSIATNQPGRVPCKRGSR